ncbi:MAG: TetR family transcriptional regulator [Jatrophihabitans sp.]|uniref:TetR/AcrR family transcriptional regulator n=1 Tax=Jatrophihabitans sp. TaxID=1932789 RepID=UPI003F7D22E0
MNTAAADPADFQRARTPEQQEHRRQHILATAQQLLDERPLTEISLRDLAREVGLAKSNVVRYFPTREAVFLAVLVDDWTTWLDALADALPRPDARRARRTTHRRIAEALATTLLARPRLCRLISSTQTVLERNVPADATRAFKRDSLTRTRRLADLLRAADPELRAATAFELAGTVWTLVAGAWPVANPSPVAAAVLRDPEFAALALDFRDVFVRIVVALLGGLDRAG